MEKQLKSLIDKAHYISFDIFDTLIQRNTIYPTDIFTIVENKYKNIYGENPISLFKQSRIKAENIARQINKEKYNQEEINLDEIYAVLAKNCNLDSEICNKYKDLEVQIEIDFCVENLYMKEMYEYCLKKGKKVIISSDMYLPEHIIKKILDKNNYTDYERLFLSSSLRLTKHNGSMFNFILKELNCSPNKILHIGDNKRSDFDMPEKLGILAFYYQKALDKALTSDEFQEKELLFKPTKDLDPDSSIYLALIINKFYCNRSKNINKSNDLGYQIGYKYIGLTLYGFLDWIYLNTKENNLDKIFFCSREGYIMQKVFQILFPDVISEYFYTSRRLLHIPSLTIDLNDEKQSNHILEYLLTLKYSDVASFLEFLKLTPDKYKKEIRDSGFKNLKSMFDPVEDILKITKLWSFILPNLIDKANIEKENLFGYYKQVDLFNLKKAAFIDIGWHGRIQNSLERLLHSLENKPEIYGYYIGLMPTSANFKSKYNMSGYLFDNGENFFKFNNIDKYLPLMEFLFMAPHASIIGLKKLNNRFEPVFDNDNDKDKIKVIQNIHDGILDFICDFKEIKQKYSFINANKELSIKLLCRLLNNPSYKEACYLGNIKHIDGCKKAYNYIANPFQNIFAIINQNRLFEEYKKNNWKPGFKKRIENHKFYSKFINSNAFDLKNILNSKFINKKIKNFSKTYKNARICCYGAGLLAKELVNQNKLNDLNIISFIDADINKKGTMLGNYLVSHINDLSRINPEVILITAVYNPELITKISNYLKENNIKSKIIYNIF